MPRNAFVEKLVAAIEADRAREFLSDGRLPRVAALAEVPAGPAEYHEEGDALTHTILTVEAMVEQRPDDDVAIVMALVHDIGKAETPSDDLPNHYGHEDRGVEPAEQLAADVGFDDADVQRVGKATELHMKVHDVPDLNATTVLDMVGEMRDVDLSVGRLVSLGRADALGHRPRASFDAPSIRSRLRAAEHALDTNDLASAAERRGYEPEEIGDTVARSEVANWRRQDRAEAMRSAFGK